MGCGTYLKGTPSLPLLLLLVLKRIDILFEYIGFNVTASPSEDFANELWY